MGCVVLFLSFQAIAQMQGTWATTAGNLPSPVESNTQVLLANGDVLVAGGWDGTNYSAAAQLYNPSTGTWKATGSMHAARAYFAAVVLQGGPHNGWVLVEGGLAGGSTIVTTAELYNPSTGTWSSAGMLPHPRYGHTATLLTNGDVMVTGGCVASSCSAVTGATEIYTPNSTTGTWTTTGALHIPRAYQTATRLLNGKVLLVGGVPGTKSCELYDPTHGTWTTAVASTLVLRYQHAAALLASGRVLVTGGKCGLCANFSAEIYDPNANTWTATGNMTLGRFGHSATTLANNTVLIAAGGTFSGRYYRPTAKTEIYDVVTGKFTATAPLNQLRMSQTASLLGSGQVMVVGGLDNNGLSSTAEVYTPLTLSISKYSLNLGLEQKGVTSPAQKVTVNNVSHSSVTFTSIAASGDFAQTNNCHSSPLAPGASCSISVTFKPTVAGTRTGAVTLLDHNVGSPTQTIALTGTGEQYAIAFTPNPLIFPPTAPHYTSTMSATVTNDGSSPVTINNITITGKEFSVYSTNCPSTLPVNQPCQIVVEFTPPDSGTYTETLKISDSAPFSPHLLTLTGTGTD